VISIKPGARMLGVRAEILIAVPIACDILTMWDKELVITTGTDGKHKASSMHHAGWALDLRTRHLSEGQQRDFRDIMIKRLGSEYDVVLHKTHLHVEYDPRKG
jgi:hypothetical protein